MLQIGTMVAAVSLGLFLVFWLSGRKLNHLMDPGDKPGAFEPHIKRYQDLARLVLTLAAATIAFLVTLRTREIPAGSAGRDMFLLRQVAPQAILYLCAAIFFLLFFTTLLNFFYENYTHFHYLPVDDPDRKNGRGEYRRWKYALVLSCGYSGLAWFFSAYFILAKAFMQ